MIEVTQKAAGQIRKLMAQQEMNSGGLRVGVVGGGCSGLSYSLRFDPASHPRDKIFELEGVKIFVDPKSYLYLNGMTLEFSDGLNGRGFVFTNPNATRSCGCGSSFSS
jgi:iron-sulfur cluster assembly protein